MATNAGADVTLEQALGEATKNERVCPLPMKWNALYELLPDRKRKGSGWEPSLPLILAAWGDSPHLAKVSRLREHIEWAEQHGVLREVYSSMAALSEGDWLHFGD